MEPAPGTATGTGPIARRRVRPSGWAPGTGSLVGAWLASAAIARLTGAVPVILVLAATLVALAFEVVGGWWSTRSIRVRSVLVPSVVDAGEQFAARLTIDAPPSLRSSDRRRITLAGPDGTVVSLDPPSTGDFPDDHVTACIETAGVVRSLTVSIYTPGPAGLIWWKHSQIASIDPLHVAPPALGPTGTVEVAAAIADGSAPTARGNHAGDIDGIRAWRRGDSMNAVHWASSLRTDELIVHDRVTAADERWIVELACDDAGRLRSTIDEGRRLGHDVAVRTPEGAIHRVLDDLDAARWSAIAAELAQSGDSRHHAGARRIGLMTRTIRFTPPATKLPTPITAPTRWAAATAAFASLAMLTGAIDGSPLVLALVLAAVIAGAAVSLWVAHRGGRRPVILQVLIVAAILSALGFIALRAADVDGILAALRGPLPNVLMLLVVLHGFETVDRRTLRVHLAITFVLASYAAGLSIDSTLGWWLAAWGLAFVTSLLTSLRSPGRRTARGPASPYTVHSARRTERTRASTNQPARNAARWALTGVALAAITLVVLSLVPIPDGPARLGLPALSTNDTTVDSPGALAGPDGSSATSDGADDRAPGGNAVGYPGFTDSLDTSVRGELGDEIVMRVRAPEPAFWRGQTFTEFDGRTWTVSPELGRPQDGPVIDVPPTIGDALGSPVPSRELVQTYYVEQDLPNVVFAAHRATQVLFDGTLWTRPDGALRSDVTLTAGSVYTVISERVQVDAGILRSQGDLGAFYAGFRDMAGGEELEPFLGLPDSTTQRTIDLATSLRTPGTSTYDTILAYEAWLGANTRYDLDAPVPADGVDAVDDFLFESQLGFCEQIASTLTIMLRSQGVPARLATGYVPGERDRVSGVWNVRGSDAHAWVEVWFPQTGWQAFDPTAEVPLAADAGGATIGGDLLGATLSSAAAFRLEVAVVLLLAGLAIVVVRLIDRARYRRRRGRWGMLQDRFAALGDRDSDDILTNARIASTVAGPDDEAAARTVAEELDRAAFDPSWVDDDERFDRARSALAVLERAKR